jgi:ATP-dependent Zn protease
MVAAVATLPVDYIGLSAFLPRSAVSQLVTFRRPNYWTIRVREIIEHNYELAGHILETNLGDLHRLAHALIRYETLDREQIREIMESREVVRAA